MTLPKVTKTTRRRRRRTTGTITRLGKKKSSSSLEILEYLPSEIIGQIVAQVAASSFDDLLCCKLSCKALLEITKEKHVLERASLDGLPSFLWSQNEHAHSFFKDCQECRNPEALFQLGIWQYFSCVMVEEGKANLEKARGQGHMGATYALSLIYLCTGDLAEKERGVSILIDVMERFGGKGIVECRKKLQETMRYIWMNNNLIKEEAIKQRFLCAMEDKHGSVRHGWKWSCNNDDEWEERVVCQTCRCQRELSFFSKLLPTT